MEERINRLIKDGAKSVNVVSLSMKGNEGWRKTRFKARISSSFAMSSDADVNIYSFSESNKDLLVDQKLLREVIMPSLGHADAVPRIYDYLVAHAAYGHTLRVMMKEFKVPFSILKEYIERMVSSGILVKIKERGTEKNPHLFPYCYSGTNPRMVLLKHLLSWGYGVEMQGFDILYAARLKAKCAFFFDANAGRKLCQGYKSILVSENKDAFFEFDNVYSLSEILKLGSF